MSDAFHRDMEEIPEKTQREKSKMERGIERALAALDSDDQVERTKGIAILRKHVPVMMRIIVVAQEAEDMLQGTIEKITAKFEEAQREQEET